MPGVYQYSVDRLNEIMDKVKESGISGVLLFGIPACKDEMGTQAYAKDGIIRSTEGTAHPFPYLWEFPGNIIS